MEDNSEDSVVLENVDFRFFRDKKLFFENLIKIKEGSHTIITGQMEVVKTSWNNIGRIKNN